MSDIQARHLGESAIGRIVRLDQPVAADDIPVPGRYTTMAGRVCWIGHEGPDPTLPVTVMFDGVPSKFVVHPATSVTLLEGDRP